MKINFQNCIISENSCLILSFEPLVWVFFFFLFTNFFSPQMCSTQNFSFSMKFKTKTFHQAIYCLKMFPFFAPFTPNFVLVPQLVQILCFMAFFLS